MSEVKTAAQFQHDCLKFNHCAEAIQTKYNIKSKYNLCYNDGSGRFEDCAHSPVELIDQAEMMAEACAKYGPDDPDDDSCAQQKQAEVKLKREFDLCAPKKGIYEFVKCGE